MSDWWTYRLSDFLLFAPRTYYRLVELYNTDVWPAHLVALAIGVSLLALLRSPSGWRSSAIAMLLAACWFWVAWAFHLQRYATINWAAEYFAALFAIEAMLFVTVGAARRDVWLAAKDRSASAARHIVAFALLAQPWLGLVEGRAWRELETFAIAPDPTVIATLGVLLSAQTRASWILWPIPLLWCFTSGAIGWTMGSPVAFVVPLIGSLAAVLALANSRRPSNDPARTIPPTSNQR